jgi:hypothetical protein
VVTLQGAIDSCSMSRVTGWAVESGEPAALDIYVNGSSVGHVRCDQPRPDLAAAGLPADAGFTFVFPTPIRHSDQVFVRSTGGAPLEGCPAIPERHLGAVDACTVSEVSGWAAFDEMPALLDIFVDGDKVGQMRCNLARSDLAFSRFAPACGFRFPFPSTLAGGAEVTVRFEDGTLLHGSPISASYAATGYLDVCTPVRVTGWAVEGNQPAELEVFVNATKVGKIQCNRRRPDVAAIGQPLLSGFAFLFPRPIAPSDAVSVCFLDGTHLARSPHKPVDDYTSPPFEEPIDSPDDTPVYRTEGGEDVVLSTLGLSPLDFELVRGGQLFAALGVKRCLAANYGVREGFEIFRVVGQLPHCARIEKRRLTSMAAAARQAHAYHEIAPAGEPFEMTPPRVIGEGNARRLSALSRAVYLARFDDVFVRGRSAFVEIDCRALLDFEHDELERLDDELLLDPAVFSRGGDELDFVLPGQDEAVLEIDEAFRLIGPHTTAFGNWMWQYLPQYVAALLAGLPPNMPVLVDGAGAGGMPRQHLEMLRALLPPGASIIELKPYQRVKVNKLWCASSQMHVPVLQVNNDRFRWEFMASPPWRFGPIIRDMARRVAANLPEGGEPVERVFLARRKRKVGHQHRLMANDAVIQAVAQARGFRIVYPEDLSFTEQVLLVRDARYLMGPEGSAFFLAFFARRRLRICMLDHAMVDGLALYDGPLGSVGHETTVITGSFTSIWRDWRHNSDYQIDENVFARFLNDWLEPTT